MTSFRGRQEVVAVNMVLAGSPGPGNPWRRVSASRMLEI